jgi:AraC family transcriptional regulator, transcriptional activator FtrA
LRVAQKTIIVSFVPNLAPRSSKFSLPHRVAVLAYDGLCTFEFGIAVELFGLPRPELKNWYDFEVCGLEPRPLTATGGVVVQARRGLNRLLAANTIIIPGWRNPKDKPPERLVRILQRAHARGVRLMSICSGVFVLAATGLLDGKFATTHWKYFENLSSAYPRIHLKPNVLYVDEGTLLTSAGSAAGIDLSLHLIRKDFGAAIANKIAKRLIVPPHREGGQAQFVDTPVGEEVEPWLSNTFDWARHNLHRDIRIAELARRAYMTRRTFARRFRAATGSTPLEWINGQRTRLACDLLETTDLGMDAVADRSGFGSTPVLRDHFRRRMCLSPSAYRERFRCS